MSDLNGLSYTTTTMSSNFKPLDNFGPSNEKDWAANLGMLDWDDTRIVFTKRSLIEFLKYTGTTVDPNFTNISKLPRYAKFGKLLTSDESGSESTAPIETQNQEDRFKPTHCVRQAPGGTTSSIFGQDAEDDALSSAPVMGTHTSTHYKTSNLNEQRQSQGSVGGLPWDPAQQDTEFKPTRKVRERPGGKDSFWDMTEEEVFKPTRKVRERPGGKDSIGGLLGDL